MVLAGAGGLLVARAADLPGRVGEAEAADQDGAGAPQGVPHLAAALSARDLAARRDYHRPPLPNKPRKL